jgi:hypothetical protein
MVINQSPSVWHYDPGDIGLTAVLYFGDFIGGELKIGPPLNSILPVLDGDVIFLNSSQIYHSSNNFSGTRYNVILYTAKINNELLISVPELF